MLKKIHFLLFLIVSVISATSAFAQLGVVEEEVAYKGANLSSPYHTTLTFFYNLEEHHYQPEKAAKTLNLEGIAPNSSDELAVKLKQIFDGKGVFVRINEIPNNPVYRDSTTAENEQIYYFDKIKLPKVFLTKEGAEWKFSNFTVKSIEEMHSEIYPYGTAKLLNLLPKIGTQEYLGLKAWQIAGMAFIIAFIFLSHWIFTIIIDKVLMYLFRRYGYDKVGREYILPVARVISIYFIVVLLSVFLRVLQLPIELWSWLVVIIRTLKPLLVTIIFYKLVNVISAYFTKLATKTESTLDDQLVPLLRKTLKAFVVIIGTLFILKDGLNLDIIPFLTGLSIGGVAIALAAQDTIKNFFGSVMIFIDKPFQVGDWITSGDIDGSVEEVGFRSTRVRTFRDSLLYVPNAKIADSTVDNHGLRKYRRFYTTLNITFDTPPELIEEFVKGMREIVLAHPYTRKDYYNIYLHNISSHSYEIMLYIFFKAPDWGAELQGRQDVLLNTLKLADKLGVRLAFPTQTLHVERFPEKKGLIPEHSGDYEANLNDFIQNELKGIKPRK